MSYSSLFVPKDSGTYSDTLLLFGLEKLVSHVILNSCQSNTVSMINHGSYFELAFETPITIEMLERTPYGNLSPFILEKEGQSRSIGSAVSLSENYAKLKTIKDLPADLKKDREQMEKFKLDPNFEVAVGIKDLKAITTYNAMVEEIAQKKDRFSRILLGIFEWFSTPFSQTAKLPEHLVYFSKKEITKLSICNPLAGKGVHHPAPGNLSPSNKSDYWFLEWLKFLGLFKIGFVKRVGGDTKVYVLEPKYIANCYYVTSVIKNKFINALPNTALTPIKADIIMILRFLKALLLYAEEENSVLDDTDPKDLVCGFHTAYFLNMGQAKVVSNISFLKLPSWMSFQNSYENYRFSQLVENHVDVINGLNEDGNTSLMLQAYRDFLIGEETHRFFDFYAPFAELVLAQLGEPFERRRYKYIVPFLLQYLDEVMQRMESKWSRIIQSPGFKNIATAIRKSTIILQYIPKSERLYEVRYGMAQDLKRKSAKVDQLIEYISDFCASFNQENARVYEQTSHNHEKYRQKYRKNITKSDLDQLIDLISEYGTIVGKLLMVYGYAREEKEEDQKTETTKDQNAGPEKGNADNETMSEGESPAPNQDEVKEEKYND